MPRLQRCTSIITNDTSEDSSGIETSKILRSKPFKYTYEKEIVMYAYFKKLDYFSTECIYSPNAYRGHARVFLKDLEAVRRTTIVGKEPMLSEMQLSIVRLELDQQIVNTDSFFVIL